jgi:hypothetical protein
MTGFEIRFTKEAVKDIEKLTPKLKTKLKPIMVSNLPGLLIFFLGPQPKIPLLTTFFTFCHTSSRTQGNGRSYHRHP